MFSSNNKKIPLLFLLCSALAFAAIFCYCELYQENRTIKQELKQELQKKQEELDQLKEELNQLKRFSEIYGTSPQVVAVTLRESEKYGINPMIMLELIKAESNFDPKAVSKDGARGLCQLKPVTAKELSRELGINFGEKTLFDIDYNISLGTYYLAKLLHRHNGDYHRALTAYNRGPKGLEIYIKSRGTAVSRYSERISSRSLQLAFQFNR